MRNRLCARVSCGRSDPFDRPGARSKRKSYAHQAALLAHDAADGFWDARMNRTERARQGAGARVSIDRR